MWKEKKKLKKRPDSGRDNFINPLNTILDQDLKIFFLKKT
jgi:hypothetical protein